jgi:hypothetical protein
MPKMTIRGRFPAMKMHAARALPLNLAAISRFLLLAELLETGVATQRVPLRMEP